MNNSLINRNTTVLVLVILILGFIYMNLQNNQSMTGGAVDCDLFVPIVKKIIAKDTLYKFTIGSTPGLIVYILLILVLVYLGYNYSKYELTLKKSPLEKKM
jgi:ABC-type branched-subunit amino acid transport system permease subunit